MTRLSEVGAWCNYCDDLTDHSSRDHPGEKRPRVSPERHALNVVLALHDRLHWCIDEESNSPDVYQPGTKWWPCPTLAAVRKAIVESSVCGGCGGRPSYVTRRGTIVHNGCPYKETR